MNFSHTECHLSATRQCNLYSTLLTGGKTVALFQQDKKNWIMWLSFFRKFSRQEKHFSCFHVWIPSSPIYMPNLARCEWNFTLLYLTHKTSDFSWLFCKKLPIFASDLSCSISPEPILSSKCTSDSTYTVQISCSPCLMIVEVLLLKLASLNQRFQSNVY